MPLAAFEQWRDATASIEDLAAYANHEALLATSGDATQRNASAVSSNFFKILGVAPLLGGGFGSSDDVRGAPPRIILSHGLWQSAFGGNPAIVGTSVQIDGDEATVAGVMPAGFEYPSGAELWRSIGESLRDRRLPRSTVPIYSLVGRLRDGATLEQAERDLIAVAEQRWNVSPQLRGWLPVLRTLERRLDYAEANPRAPADHDDLLSVQHVSLLVLGAQVLHDLIPQFRSAAIEPAIHSAQDRVRRQPALAPMAEVQENRHERDRALR